MAVPSRVVGAVENLVWWKLPLVPPALLLAALIQPTHSFSPPSPPPPPPPPWSFLASRIHCSFLGIPTDVARQCIPFTEQEDNLSLLSLGGQTLGLLFAIEYVDSPIGPYREIAVLAGLVTEKNKLGIPNLLGVGAWASHIFVDSDAAALYGKKFWGLPASVVSIDLDLPRIEDDRGDNEERMSSSSPSFVFSDCEIVGVAGWTGPTPAQSDAAESTWSLSHLVDVTLPSYSGRLSPTDALLRYPLSLSNLGRISVRWATMPVVGHRETIGDVNLRRLLEEAKPLLSLNIDGARLVAGIPEVL